VRPLESEELCQGGNLKQQSKRPIVERGEASRHRDCENPCPDCRYATRQVQMLHAPVVTCESLAGDL